MTLTGWVDTHAHLTHQKIRDRTAEVLSNCQLANVSLIISAATSAADAADVVALAKSESAVRAAVGIHPNDTHLAEAGDWEKITQLAQAPEVVAIGETGLDRYWKDAPFEVQTDFFTRHLDLADALGLPVVIHCRDAMTEIIEFLKMRGRPVRGTLHCFIGNIHEAKQLMEFGLHLGIGGISTFANKEHDILRETIRQIPPDRLLVETDAPFLSPHPFRGKTNEPARVAVVGEALAKLLGISAEECREITTRNALELFQRRPPRS